MSAMRGGVTIFGAGLLVVWAWLVVSRHERSQKMGDVSANGETLPFGSQDQPRETNRRSEGSLLSVRTAGRVKHKTTLRREREPTAMLDAETEEPVELTRTQERTLAETEVEDISELLRAELGEAAKMCMGADPDASLALRDPIELRFEIGSYRGEARIKSVTYGEHSGVDDPDLPKCLNELMGGDTLPAEVLDVIDGGVLTVRLGPPRPTAEEGD